MSLQELLNERGVKSALIVDDACDTVPRAVDIGVDRRAWTIFNDDLSPEQRGRIEEEYPEATERRFEELVADDGYVATVWNLRTELGEIASLFLRITLPIKKTTKDTSGSSNENLKRWASPA